MRLIRIVCPRSHSPKTCQAPAPGVRQALEATRHLLEMYRRQLGDEKIRRTLQRLDKRLLGVASQLQKIQ